MPVSYTPRLIEWLLKVRRLAGKCVRPRIIDTAMLAGAAGQLEVVRIMADWRW